MAIKGIEAEVDALRDVVTDLLQIDFEFPVEPAEDAPADAWRYFGLEVADKLAEAEKAVLKAIDALE